MSNKAFADILNTPVDDIVAPKPTPIGTWTFAINIVKVLDPKDADMPGVLLFGLKPQAPGVDVNPDEAAALDLESAQEWNRFQLRDKRDAYRIRKFLEAAGVETSGRTLIEAAMSAEGYEVNAYVDHEPARDDPELTYVRMKDFGPVS